MQNCFSLKPFPKVSLIKLILKIGSSKIDIYNPIKLTLRQDITKKATKNSFKLLYQHIATLPKNKMPSLCI